MTLHPSSIARLTNSKEFAKIEYRHLSYKRKKARVILIFNVAIKKAELEMMVTMGDIERKLLL